MGPSKLTVEVEVKGLEQLERAAVAAEKIAAVGQTALFRFLRVAVYLLAGIALAGALACGPGAVQAPDGDGWERLGRSFYRRIDRDLGVVCYSDLPTSSSPGLSCVKLDDTVLDALEPAAPGTR
jgi:hypothetical protein